MDLIPEGYTRVSDILSIYQSYAHIPKERLKKAQEIGTDVHSAIEAFLNEDFRPLASNKNPYFDSFLCWAVKVRFKPLFMEKRLFDHNLKITGRIDFLCEMDDEIVLVDFKTGSWAHPEIWKLQGTFYRHLLEIGDYPVPDKFLFLQLQKDGSEPKKFEFTHLPCDWIVCEAALISHAYFTKGLEYNSPMQVY